MCGDLSEGTVCVCDHYHEPGIIRVLCGDLSEGTVCVYPRGTPLGISST